LRALGRENQCPRRPPWFRHRSFAGNPTQAWWWAARGLPDQAAKRVVGRAGFSSVCPQRPGGDGHGGGADDVRLPRSIGVAGPTTAVLPVDFFAPNFRWKLAVNKPETGFD